MAPKKTWPRLPPSAETRAKISASLSLRRKSRDHKDKISRAMKGKEKTPEHRAKISEGRTRPWNERPGFREERKERLRREKVLRRTQLLADLQACAELGDSVLYQDVKASAGFRERRTKYDDLRGRVSDGFSQGRIWWPIVRLTTYRA